MSAPEGATYTMDSGEGNTTMSVTDLEEMIRVNTHDDDLGSLDAEDVDKLRSMKPGEYVSLGGGAEPLITIKRIS